MFRSGISPGTHRDGEGTCPQCCGGDGHIQPRNAIPYSGDGTGGCSHLGGPNRGLPSPGGNLHFGTPNPCSEGICRRGHPNLGVLMPRGAHILGCSQLGVLGAAPQTAAPGGMGAPGRSQPGAGGSRYRCGDSHLFFCTDGLYFPLLRFLNSECIASPAAARSPPALPPLPTGAL